MTMLSIGDLAQSFIMRRQNLVLKEQVTSLSQELASGRKTDISKALGGDWSYITHIERSMNILDGYKIASSEATYFTKAMQDTLQKIQDLTEDLGTRLIASSSSHIASVVSATSETSRQDFETLVSALNTAVGGRSLFSGEATDQAPLISADELYEMVRNEIVGETTSTGIFARIDDWFFSSGGGFETAAYQGSARQLAPFQLGEHESVQFSMKADDYEIRVLLRNTVVGALSADNSLGFAPPLQRQLQQSAGEALLSAQDGLTKIRSDLGYVQERVEEAKAQNAVAVSSLEQTRNDLLAADPYETATRLENAQFQLESLYTLTVRMSQLNLMDFMR